MSLALFGVRTAFRLKSIIT